MTGIREADPLDRTAFIKSEEVTKEAKKYWIVIKGLHPEMVELTKKGVFIRNIRALATIVDNQEAVRIDTIAKGLSRDQKFERD